MASLNDAKTIYGGFANDSDWQKIVYDYDVDGGATGDYTVFTAGNDMVIVDFYANMITEIDGAGTTTSDLGVDAAGTGLWSAKSMVAAGTPAFAAGDISGKTTAAPLRLPSASAIVFSLDGSVVTQGKVEFNFDIRKQ
jgi:hypothetical protein